MSTANSDFDLEFFFNLSPDLLCIAGFDGYFKKINPAVSQTLGYTDEELFASPINSFVHPDDQKVTDKKRESIRRDNQLLDFENRYITKSGEVIWLTWTSVPVPDKKLVFAIAKNITHRKKIEEYRRISGLFSNHSQKEKPEGDDDTSQRLYEAELSAADQLWIDEFEELVRKYIGKLDLNLNILADEMAISERQIFRRIKSILGITPNQFIRIIRLQIAREAIASGRYRTVAEVAGVAGFDTPTYFNKLYKEVYFTNVTDLL